MNLIPFFVIIPLSGAFILSLLRGKLRYVPELICIFCTFLLLQLSFYVKSLFAGSPALVYKIGSWLPPMGISLVLDGLSSLILIIVNLIAFVVALFSIQYMKQYTARWNFFTLFLLMLGGTNAVIVSGDLFNLYVFLELASISSAALVAFGTGEQDLEAAFKYIVMSVVGSLFILLAIALLYSYTSTLNMADIVVSLQSRPNAILTSFVAVLFIMGFGLKAGLVPFHAWLPDAYLAAPTPVSALLAGVFTKSLGVYTLMRVLFNVLDMTPNLSKVVMVLGVLSMIVGVILAVGQWDFKRLLAYHSISQIGYVVLAIGLMTPFGIFAGLFHLFNHATFKSLLFLNAGAVEYATGTRDLNQLGGLRKKMPVTSGTSLIASMAISGIPPFNGFWSKLMIILACVHAQALGFAAWAVIGSILTLISFAKLQKYVFFAPLREQLKNIKEVPLLMRLSMIILAFLCIFGGLLILAPVAKIYFYPAVDTLLEGQSYAFRVLEALK